jgi:phenylalanyl-tRNA synthetase beta chain
MKVLLSWIKEYLDFNLSPEKVAETLTLAGIEVESMDMENGEVIFDISLTPNLGHCMSIIGLSRELAALLHLKLKRHKIEFNQDLNSSIEKMISIQIEDSKKCHRYGARLVKNITVAPSPTWLKERLEACGYRSINNVVDIGNYVMLECGQPLHLFDYDKIAGKKIHISSKTSKKFLLTLDDQERKIPDDVLLICDANEPIAFAGVIGGKQSAVTDESKNVLIEAAFFTPEAVRKTSKLLGLRTEASGRFERGVDPEGVPAALERATELLLQIAGGIAVKDEIDKIAVSHPPQILECRISRINKLLGTNLSIREVADFFERLEIKIEKEAPDLLVVIIPTHRHDLKAEIDLIEEIARLYGYNHIPKRIPKHVSSSIPHAPLFIFEEEMRRKLLSQGLQEFLTCDLISPQQSKLSTEKTLNTSSLISVL